MKFQLSALEQTIDQAYNSGNIVKHLSEDEIPFIPKGIELSRWECMILSKMYCVPGEVGELVLAFPPGGSPAELIPHTHGGGRVITIIAGVGLFQVKKDDHWIDIELKRGVQVMFPKETLHTFIGIDGKALLAHALHAPFLPPEHPRAIVYEDGTRQKHYDTWDPREYFPHILGEPTGPLSLVCSTKSVAA